MNKKGRIKNGRFKQGLFTPKNTNKYRGDLTDITYMSSWELDAMKFLDGNTSVLEWSSEPIAIPYMKPTDKKVHRYYPDFWVKYRKKGGQVVEELWEVKPDNQTRPTRRRKARQRLIEQVQYAVNMAKWGAAKKYCDKYGMTFRIVTEKSGLFK